MGLCMDYCSYSESGAIIMLTIFPELYLFGTPVHLKCKLGRSLPPRPACSNPVHYGSSMHHPVALARPRQGSHNRTVCEITTRKVMAMCLSVLDSLVAKPHSRRRRRAPLWGSSLGRLLSSTHHYIVDRLRTCLYIGPTAKLPNI